MIWEAKGNKVFCGLCEQFSAEPCPPTRRVPLHHPRLCHVAIVYH